MSIAEGRLRVGVVGLGAVAREFHLPALISSKQFELVAGAEINADRRERIRKMFNIPEIYASYQEMYQNARLDVVFVCISNQLHYRTVVAALKAGLHVVCEKPMGTSALEARSMVDLAQQSELVLLPAYNLRFVETFVQAKEKIAHGIIGDLVQIQGTFFNPGPYITWDPKSDWHFDKQGYGVLYDLGSHLVDLMLYMTGIEVESVSAFSLFRYSDVEVPTNISCAFRAKNKIIGSLSLGWGTGALRCELQLHGTAGVLLVDQHQLTHLYRGIDPIERSIAYGCHAFAEIRSAFKRKLGAGAISPEHKKLTRNAADVILGRAFPVTSSYDAIRTHEILESIRTSLDQNGNVVSVKPETTQPDKK